MRQMRVQVLDDHRSRDEQGRESRECHDVYDAHLKLAYYS